MFKRTLLALAVISGTFLAGSASAQVDPNGGGGPGPGGFQIDPAMMDQIQQMQQMGQQIMQNMQNAGVDPQQFFQDQMQNGNFDPAAMQQSLVDKGYMTQDQATQMQSMMTSLQQNFQNQGGNLNTMRTTMQLNNIRQQLGVAADDEWNVLLPKIQRVLADLADVRQNNPNGLSNGTVPGNPAGNFGGMQAAGAQPGAPAVAETPLAKAWRELCEATQDAQRSETDIATKLATWRQLHMSAQADLAAAQQNLTQFVTLRQESTLMILGLL